MNCYLAGCLKESGRPKCVTVKAAGPLTIRAPAYSGDCLYNESAAKVALALSAVHLA
jgi:hypothetical protein